MSNETKHTPGPWEMGKRHPGRVTSATRVIAHATAHPEDTDNPHAEEMANARLIAAAPDLLAALKRLLAQNEAMGFRHSEAEELARGFILKAEGKTS